MNCQINKYTKYIYHILHKLNKLMTILNCVHHIDDRGVVATTRRPYYTNYTKQLTKKSSFYNI